MERIELALGRIFYADSGEIRVEDRGTRWRGLCACVLLISAGYGGFLHGVMLDDWYAVPALLCAVLAFLVLVRLVAGALMQQTFECSPHEVALRRFRFGHAVSAERIQVDHLALVTRGLVARTKFGPVPGLVFTDRNGLTLHTLRSMPSREMQALLLRLQGMRYPVRLDVATPFDVHLGEPYRGLWKWL